MKVLNKVKVGILVVLIDIVKEFMKLEGNFKGIFIELLKKLKYWNKDIFCEIGKLNLVIEIFENLFDFIV